MLKISQILFFFPNLEFFFLKENKESNGILKNISWNPQNKLIIQ
jgi:hypothetical protein